MNEPIDADFAPASTALAVPTGDAAPPAPVGLFNTDDPKVVVEKAVGVADALMAIVKAKGWARRIGPKDHLEIQAWQTIAAMLGVSTECEWSRQVQDPAGWEARVVVRNARGQTIASAESQCTRDERKWTKSDEYAVRSMAQTRATSKALRMALGFIANIAGFSATPADEMPPEDAPRGRATEPARHEAPQRDPEAQRIRDRLKELLQDTRLTPTEREACILDATGDTAVSSITTPEKAADVIARLEAMIEEAEAEIPF